MFRRIGLAPIVAAAVALTGCEPGPVVGPGNDSNTVETNAGQTNATAAQGAPTGGTCGTLADIQCSAATDFCKLPEGQCDVPDAAGTCTARPEVCIKPVIPVCGCDNKTYSNACEADAAGVSVRAQGECPKPDGEAGSNAAS
ncbi:MAG TPA: hypothetical protein VFZ91_01400 [Allosphingosinicella sp.]